MDINGSFWQGSFNCDLTSPGAVDLKCCCWAPFLCYCLGTPSQLPLVLPGPPAPLLCWHPASSRVTSAAPCSLAELAWPRALAELALASVQYTLLTNIMAQLPVVPCIFPQIRLFSALLPQILPQCVQSRFGEDQHFALTIAYVHLLCSPDQQFP